MSASVRVNLNALCDEAMVQSIKLFPNCKTLIGIGRYAEDRIKRVCKKYQLNYEIGYLMHPSPRNPTANREWSDLATKCLHDFGLLGHPSVDHVKRDLFNP